MTTTKQTFTVREALKLEAERRSHSVATTNARHEAAKGLAAIQTDSESVPTTLIRGHAPSGPTLPEAPAETPTPKERRAKGGQAPKGRPGDGAGSAQMTACVQRISDIEARELQPLWPGVVWRGKTTLLVGDPGLGKSQITCDVAARITRGSSWPCSSGEAPTGDVLLLSAEDDVADTLRPRLEAAGADTTRVHFLSSVLVRNADGGGMRQAWPSLLEHIEALRAAMAKLPSLALVVIDPVTAYLQGVDSHKTAEVRTVLGLLAQLAAERNVGLLCVSHLNKAPGGQSLYRVTGSLAFVAAARSAYLVARDPQNSDARLMLCLKNNLAKEPAGFRYVIRESDNNAPYIEWADERVTMTADEALAPTLEETPRTLARNRRTRETEDWLRGVLKHGPVDAASVWRKADRDGFTEREVRRASKALAVEKALAGYQGRWHWALPPGDDAKSTAVDCPSLSATETL